MGILHTISQRWVNHAYIVVCNLFYGLSEITLIMPCAAGAKRVGGGGKEEKREREKGRDAD